MNDPRMRPSTSATSGKVTLDVEVLLQRQSDSWRLGRRLTVEELLLEANSFDATQCNVDTLLSLICQEVAFRRSNEELCTLEEYRIRFPHLAEELKIQWEIDELLRSSSIEARDMTLETMNVSQNTAIKNSNRRSLILPSNIGRYEIVREVGRGAIGVVYEAWDPKLKRRVALKRLKAGVDATAEELLRMRAEAEAIAKLHHPNIVQIYDVGEDGWPYFAMEFCNGRSLDKRLAGQPLDPRVAAELVRKISLGISVAHENRIIHRDLKPANVLLEGEHDWSPKVVDFGLAKFLDGDSSATASGSILGTPAYMAPEQAFGDAKRVGESADIYSLGAILYECLTGRPPFRGVTIGETLDQVRNREPVSVRQLEPKVPLDLETITHTCLRKDPKQRYTCVGELVDDLARFLDRKPIAARRERWYELTWRLARRYPTAASLCIATVGLLLALTIGSLVFANYMYETQVTIQREKASAQLGHAEALVGRAHGIRLSGKPGQRFDALESIRQAAKIGRELSQPTEWFEELRDEAIASLQLPDIYTQNYHEEGRILISSDFNDDHLLCALSFQGGVTSLRRMSDQHEIAEIPAIDEENRLAFIGNGRLLQFGQKCGIFELWNVDTPTPERVWRRESDCNRFYLSEDQKNLAIANATTIQWIDLEDGTTRFNNVLSPFLRERRISVHPTLPIYIIYGYSNSQAELRDIATGKTLWEFECDIVGDERFSGAAWSPDGTRLALLHGHSAKIYWFRFEASSQTLTRESDQISRPEELSWGASIRFDHSGGYLLGYDWGDGAMLVDSFRKRKIASGGGLTVYDRLAPRIDPRGEMLGFSPSLDHPTQVGTLKIAPGDDFPCLFWNEQNKYSIGNSRLDPTGSFVIIPGQGGFVIIDLASRQELLRTEIQDFDGNKICFDRNGHFLLSTAHGVFRWPYQLLESPRREIALGIPSRIPLPPSAICIASSDQGDTIAAGYWNGLGTAEYAGCWMMTTDEIAGRKVISGNTGGNVAVSNDGGACILNSANRPLLLRRTARGWGETQLSNAAPSQFVCDGRIAIAGDTLWSFPEWREMGSLPSRTVCISEDAKQIGIATQSGLVCLAHTESGKPFARFPGSPIQFSNDAESVLFVSTKDLKIARLPLIRHRLIELGIPWNGPVYLTTTEQGLPIKRGIIPDWMANVTIAQQLMDLIDQRSIKSANRNPNNPHDLFASGMVLLNHRRLKPALEQLVQVCQLMPDSVTAPQWWAYALAAMTKFDEAVQVADGVLNRVEDVDFRLMRAEWLYQAKQFARARDECTSLVDCDERTARNAYGLRRLCHEKLGQVDEVIEDMKQFRLLAPGEIARLNLNARIWTGPDLSLRHPILAQLYVDKLLQEHSRFLPEVQETIAITLIRNGRYNEAMEYCQELLKNPTILSYGFGLACQSLCQANLGDLAESQISLDTLSRWERPELHDAKREIELQSLILESHLALRGKQP